MKLELFKTLWGHDGTIREAAELASKAEFNGIEGPVPVKNDARTEFIDAIGEFDLGLIAEVSTCTEPGMYVPTPHRSVTEHLDSLKAGVEASLPANPRFINTMAGYDAWGFEEVIDFHSGVIDLESEYGIAISLETHRGRPLNNPWRTGDVLRELPDLKITCDFSHFCVVAERLVLEEEPEILALCAQSAHHLQPRVGYSQGPQVTDPRAPEFRNDLETHEKWWNEVYDSRCERGATSFTMTPEFGPDGYLHTLPYTEEPLADLWEINQWIGHRQRDRFQKRNESNESI